MDADVVERIRERYKGDTEVQALIRELARLELKLNDADILAMTVDVLVQRGGLGSRSLVGDARLGYGEPWEYEHADREILLRYKDGLEEVKRKLSDREQ